MKKYIVELTREQREELSHMISSGKASARDLMHARLLLKADQGPQGPGWSDARIAGPWKSARGRWPACGNAARLRACRKPSCRCQPNGCASVGWTAHRRRT